MGLLSFIKDAGEKLLGKSDPQVSETSPLKPSAAEVERLQKAAGKAIADYIQTQHFPVTNLTVGYDANNATVTVFGNVPDQATREKIILCCGNVNSVQHVNDQLEVKIAADASRYYTVASGDTLSRIAKDFYGDSNNYPLIFEANRPMLMSPEKIYPGQMLRIPSIAH